jgi:hypothetical protein
VHAESDDKDAIGPIPLGNRLARAVEADADGYLWKQTVSFNAARPSQSIVTLPDDNGAPQRAADWGQGEAAITCFPAFVDPGADGLLIRIELTNSSTSVQTWFVDLLGGIDTSTAQFMPGDLSIDPSQSLVTLKHKETNQAFCLAARGGVPVQTAAVADQFFSESANVSAADSHGQSGPVGVLANDGNQQDAKAGKFGLARIDGIAIGAGEHQVVWLCIGVGKDGDAAATSAHTLLSVAEDTPSNAKIQRTGAYTQAVAAHEKSAYASGNPVIDRLMAQSLLNIPCTISRRLGVASRCVPGESTYRPDIGGYIGLGWTRYRPDWTASQLNAWFATLSDPSAPLNPSHARRSADIFAAWQLYQETGSENLLKYLYPFVRHRYQELVSGCRIAADSWLFAWPEEQPDGTTAQPANPIAIAECSAQIAASAQILSHMASIVARPVDEINGYNDDRTHCMEALNRDLWSSSEHTFASRAASSVKSGGAFGRSDLLAGILPLIAGADSLTDERRAALFKRLKDPADFWSSCGIRSVSRISAAYRPSEWTQGGINYGDNWLLWQGLLDLGETGIANELATNLVDGYIRAATATAGLPQYLDGDSGAGCGAMDWSGDAGCIAWLYASYHVRGTVTSGGEIAILDHHYDNAADSARIVYKPQSIKTPGALLCVMGKPTADYAVAGDVTLAVKSDANGVVTLDLHGKAGTQQITIAPGVSAAK